MTTENIVQINSKWKIYVRKGIPYTLCIFIDWDYFYALILKKKWFTLSSSKYLKFKRRDIRMEKIIRHLLQIWKDFIRSANVVLACEVSCYGFFFLKSKSMSHQIHIWNDFSLDKKQSSGKRFENKMIVS